MKININLFQNIDGKYLYKSIKVICMFLLVFTIASFFLFVKKNELIINFVNAIKK